MGRNVEVGVHFRQEQQRLRGEPSMFPTLLVICLELWVHEGQWLQRDQVIHPCVHWLIL